jgi:hypothetical protein
MMSSWTALLQPVDASLGPIFRQSPGTPILFGMAFLHRNL